MSSTDRHDCLLGGLNAVCYHACNSKAHASKLAAGDVIPKEHPAPKQHQNGLGVAKHLQQHVSHVVQTTMLPCKVQNGRNVTRLSSCAPHSAHVHLSLTFCLARTLSALAEQGFVELHHRVMGDLPERRLLKIVQDT